MSSQQVSWGDPTPAVLFGLGAALLPLGLFTIGLIPLEASPMIAAWLLGLAVIEVVGGIIILRRGDTLMGSAALFFGCILCIGGGVSGLLHTWWLLAGQATSIPLQYEGWSWLASGVAVLLFVPATARASWSLFLAFLEIAICLILLGLAYISGMTWTTTMVVSGWMLFIFALYCFYAGLVILTNTIYAKPLLSLGGPLIK